MSYDSRASYESSGFISFYNSKSHYKPGGSHTTACGIDIRNYPPILESGGNEGMKLTLKKFWHQQASWSQNTFGADNKRGPRGPLLHLKKEVDEVLADSGNIIEYADCLFLVFDACRRAGFFYNDLVSAAFYKLGINRRRKWSKPTSDLPVEHDRNEE